MKKTAILFGFFVILFFHHSFSQTVWKKYYNDFNNTLVYIDAADIDVKYDSVNNKYVFLGMGHSALGNISFYEIAATNGNLLFRNYYSGFASALKLKFIKDSKILASSSESSTKKTIFKLDSAYNIVWKFQYEFQLSVNFCGLTETSDNNILMASTVVQSTTRPILVKTDSIGGVIWVRVCNSLRGFSKFVMETLDKKYLLGLNLRNNLGMALCKIDTSGNIIWYKSYLRPQGIMVDLLEKPNGHLIVVGNTDTTSQTPYPMLYMMELDSAGNVLWTKTYGDDTYRMVYWNGNSYTFYPIKIRSTLDGGFILATTIETQGITNHPDLVLLKTDSVGNIQWERRHGNPLYTETGINLIQTPDEGYFVVGGFATDIPTEPGGYYLLKTDSLGSVGCNEYSDSILQNNINATDSNLAVTDSLITINRTVATVDTISALPPDTLPSCAPNAVSEVNSGENEVSVYPNPSNGSFHLSMNSTDERDIFVYDMMGREIYSKTRIMAPAFDIDISRHAKGVYFLTVVSHSKRTAVKVVLF